MAENKHFSEHEMQSDYENLMFWWLIHFEMKTESCFDDKMKFIESEFLKKLSYKFWWKIFWKFFYANFHIKSFELLNLFI